MANNQYLIDKIRNLDDEAFLEVAEEITERSVTTEVKRHDGLTHITEIEDEILDEYQNWGKIKGLSTGYPALDEKIGGMGNGHVILIGGETSNGKSALATNIAVNVAKTQPVLYITLEMLGRELGSRIMHINGGKVDDLDMIFQSEFRITYKDVEPLFKKAKEQGDVKLVVLDYLQYLGRGMKLEEIAVMSKEMKTLALKYEVPFIVIVSLRKAEQGKGKRVWKDIEIEDLMGTGSIGYDADVAMIVSRKDLDNEFMEDGVMVKVLKTRNARLDYTNRFIEFGWDNTKILDYSWADEADSLLNKQQPTPVEQTTFIEV